MRGYARREFELMLLRRMADFQPEMVEDACGNQAPVRRRKTPPYAPSAPGTKPRPARDDRLMPVGDDS